ncbi:MAG: dihydroorotase [Methanospirillum sp.]|nr:dihydroorotase [Methanospirillum sp.]
MIQEEEILVLREVSVPGGKVTDITLSGGYVIHTGGSGRADREIRCQGHVVIPAGIDMHVHMRDGAQSQKEDWETGTRSALAGGVTVVVDQPNTIPPLTSPCLIRDRIRLAERQAWCRFAINGGVTSDADIPGMWQAGAMAFGEAFAGPSSYGEAVTPAILSRAMEQVSERRSLLTIHAEDVSAGPDWDINAHDRLRPVNGEVKAVTEVLNLNIPGCRLHFCHLSSASAIRTVNADPVSGSVEVTPHHLFLSREMFREDNAFGKVNPPLRSETERRSLVSEWNQIDVIASDHAPHAIQEKGNSFGDAPSGIPGVETMIPLLMAWVAEHRVCLAEVVRKTSENPARILGIEPAGFVPGCRADFAVFPEKVSVVDPDLLHSKAGWTPYEGMPAIFPEIVILGGEVVFDQGEYVHPGAGVRSPDHRLWLPGRGYTKGEPI